MNVYQMLKDILIEYVYGGVIPNDIQLVAVEIFVLAAWLFCLAIPFVLCIWFIKVLSALVLRVFG